MAAVKTSLFKSLFQLAAIHDANPVLKCTVNWAGITSINQDPWKQYYGRLTRNGPHPFALYHPGPNGEGISLQKLLKEISDSTPPGSTDQTSAFALLKALNANITLLEHLKTPADAVKPFDVKLKLEENGAPGRILISHPGKQGILARSVLMIARHDKQETLAFMLGQADKKLKDVTLLATRLGGTSLKDDVVYYGGPMNSDVVVHAFHKKKLLTPEGMMVSEGEGRPKRMLWQRLEDAKVSQGLYCSFVTETLLKSLNMQLTLGETTPDKVLFLRGLVGWEGEDMASQLQNNEWFVASCEHPEELIFNVKHDSSTFWARIMATLEGEFRDFARFDVFGNPDHR